MNWLRQQSKVESLDKAARISSAHMSLERRRLGMRIHNRLQQPGSLAWAFAAGCLAGLVVPEANEIRDGESKDRENKDGRKHLKPIPVLRYLNGAAIAWNLFAGMSAKQPLDQ